MTIGEWRGRACEDLPTAGDWLCAAPKHEKP